LVSKAIELNLLAIDHRLSITKLGSFVFRSWALLPSGRYL